MMGKPICARCSGGGSITNPVLFEFQGEVFHKNCLDNIVQNKLQGMIVSTTHSIDGKQVAKYIDIVTAEVVVGTGFWTEFGGDLSDFFGGRASGFEQKLKMGKEASIKKLKYNALCCGANAVIGIDLDYDDLSNNKLMIVASGTAVLLE